MIYMINTAQGATIMSAVDVYKGRGVWPGPTIFVLHKASFHRWRHLSKIVFVCLCGACFCNTCIGQCNVLIKVLSNYTHVWLMPLFYIKEMSDTDKIILQQTRELQQILGNTLAFIPILSYSNRESFNKMRSKPKRSIHI